MSPSEAKKILNAAFNMSRVNAEMCVAESESDAMRSALRRKHLKSIAVLRELIRAATHE